MAGQLINRPAYTHPVCEWCGQSKARNQLSIFLYGEDGAIKRTRFGAELCDECVKRVEGLELATQHLYRIKAAP